MSVVNDIKRKEVFSKVREIQITPSSDRGTIFTEKNLSDGYVEFESLLEEGLLLLLDHDPNCIDLESQPVKIPNKHKGRPYIPDAWAKFSDGTQFIFDVKHQDYLNSLENDPKKFKRWKIRTECVKRFCEKQGLYYAIITDNEIWNERFKNVQFFRKRRLRG